VIKCFNHCRKKLSTSVGSKHTTCSLLTPCRWAGSVAQVTASHAQNSSHSTLQINSSYSYIFTSLRVNGHLTDLSDLATSDIILNMELKITDEKF